MKNEGTHWFSHYATGDWRLETGDWRLETGDYRFRFALNRWMDFDRYRKNGRIECNRKIVVFVFPLFLTAGVQNTQVRSDTPTSWGHCT